MSQSLQTILNDFIKEKDKSVVKKKRTFESYITDLLKDYPAERTISVYLSQIGALYKIASPTTKNLGEGEIARYADELVQRFAVDKTKAKEMVRMWAIALGVQVPNQNSQPKSKDKEAQKDDTEEDNFFENVKRKNTIENYSEYIDKYPNGRYANEAKSKIDEFIQHKKEENIAWYKANREKIQKAYEKYLTKIDEFIQEEKADNLAWDKAKKENTSKNTWKKGFIFIFLTIILIIIVKTMKINHDHSIGNNNDIEKQLKTYEEIKRIDKQFNMFNYALAKELCYKGDDPKICLYLGFLYLNGKDVEQNVSKAIEFFKTGCS